MKRNGPPIHPGEILLEEFYKLSGSCDVVKINGVTIPDKTTSDMTWLFHFFT